MFPESQEGTAHLKNIHFNVYLILWSLFQHSHCCCQCRLLVSSDGHCPRSPMTKQSWVLSATTWKGKTFVLAFMLLKVDSLGAGLQIAAIHPGCWEQQSYENHFVLKYSGSLMERAVLNMVSLSYLISYLKWHGLTWISIVLLNYPESSQCTTYLCI